MEPPQQLISTPPCRCADLLDPNDPLSCRLCRRMFAAPAVQQQLESQAAEIERLKAELEKKDEAMQRLQQDMQTLNKKYVAEIERVADIQHEKDLVEHELEELSCKLFEEANGMVATEKREKWLLEKQLRQTEEYLQAEQSQLQELRARMQEMMLEPFAIKDPNVVRACKDLQELYGCKRASAAYAYQHRVQQQQQRISSATITQNGVSPESRTISMPPLPSQQQQKLKRVMSIDEMQLELFREFVTSSPKTPFKKLHQFAFMKHCQAEDIEPCLRFGPHSRLSVKKLNDYLSRQPCFIEQLDEEAQKSLAPGLTVSTSATTRPLWERFASSSHNNGQSLLRCSACGRVSEQENQPLSYRFRLDEMDEWAPIDQYCRDRLVAVCEFYVFIRNIQKGLYADRAIDDLYTENIRLRLQMFYSR